MLLLGSETAESLKAAAALLPVCAPDTEDAIRSFREVASGCPAFASCAAAAREILDEQGFVQVRGLPVDVVPGLVTAWACLLGDPYIDPAVGNAIVPAHVRPAQSLMGNQLRHLPLHTDYSMLRLPPRLTMSFCLKPDTTPGMGEIDVVDVEACLFGIDQATQFEPFWTVQLPFASQTTGGDVAILDSPVLGRHPVHGTLLVRYHRSRIVQGFRQRGVAPDDRECSVILAFEEFASRHIQTLTPEAGDLTVIDNHRCLHGRGRCSVEIGADGACFGRQMLFVFAN